MFEKYATAINVTILYNAKRTTWRPEKFIFSFGFDDYK
jgi:hypothetical protein